MRFRWKSSLLDLLWSQYRGGRADLDTPTRSVFWLCPLRRLTWSCSRWGRVNQCRYLFVTCYVNRQCPFEPKITFLAAGPSMATSSYFARPQRSGTHRGRLSISNALPIYFSSSSASSTAVQEKFAKKALRSSWWIPLYIPGLRRLRVFFLNPRRLHDFSMTRFGRKRGSLLLCLSISCLIFFTFALAKRFGTHAKQWPTPFTGDPPTLVYKREDLQRIWQWEVTSGHYPSRQRSELFMIYTGEWLPNLLWSSTRTATT